MKETEIKVMNDDETRDFCIRKDYEIFKKEKEIERLNNIIRDLEIELYAKYHEHKDSECEELYAKAQEDKEILDYIKELKGSDEE